MSSTAKNRANQDLVDSKELNPMKEDRSKQRVDKNTKMSSTGEDTKSKSMDRHSRMGKGRGEPKKGKIITLVLYIVVIKTALISHKCQYQYQYTVPCTQKLMRTNI